MTARWKAVVVLAIVSLALSCGDKAPGPVEPPPTPTEPTTDPGRVTVVLSTPNTNDGAVLFTLSGGVIDSLTPSSSRFTLFSVETDINTLRAIVAGDLADGAVAVFWMPDRRTIAAYSATVQQAAARSTYQQQDIGSYRLTISQ
ncbi:MAG: hypothetical protein GTN62_14290 [Gemmatimonadales bacterium]|nr:hypothetical protein [Gemmatimonadales bacterium]NIN13241.1 hypothetical protein [Gemmatimonadales bacterium]NIN51258.1 hypothetical protein [Gemmatimonadales bacterium]NIP08722.1 hypothetical protein [Gemmatimonadales bacterium]NIR00975.1 hypothetical protein [Gemmatimonadales bacterium]